MVIRKITFPRYFLFPNYNFPRVKTRRKWNLNYVIFSSILFVSHKKDIWKSRCACHRKIPIVLRLGFERVSKSDVLSRRINAFVRRSSWKYYAKNANYLKWKSFWFYRFFFFSLRSPPSMYLLPASFLFLCSHSTPNDNTIIFASPSWRHGLRTDASRLRLRALDLYLVFFFFHLSFFILLVARCFLYFLFFITSL